MFLLTLDNDKPYELVESPVVGVMNGRPMFSSVDVFLGDGVTEKVIADTGSLLWFDEGVNMTSGMVGDCCSAYMRTLSGESCCMNVYTGQGKVGFGFVLPGDMAAFIVRPNKGWMLSAGAFVCGSDNITISARFAGCCAAAHSDEGAFLTTVKLKNGEEGPGTFFAGGYGGLNRHVVPAGNTLVIDNGLFFAAGRKTKLRIGWFGQGSAGCGSMFFSSEGLGMFLNGPACIYTQNRDPSIFKAPEAKEGENKEGEGPE